MKKKNYLVKNKVGDSKYIDWTKVKVTNDLPMSGEDITKNIYKQTGVMITRQGVSCAIKLALRKIYVSLKKSEKGPTPFQIALLMFQMLYSTQPSSEDAHTFFSLLPDDIRREVRISADGRDDLPVMC